MPSVVIDFDDTLVGYRKFPEGEWIPGALDALRALRRRRYTIVIHSARANFEGGYEQIRDKLATAGFKESSRLKIHTNGPKPLGVAYVDDRAVAFDGDWPGALRKVRALAAS